MLPTLTHRSAALLFPLSLVLLLALTLTTPPNSPARTAQSADPPYRLELRAQVGGSVNAIAEDGGVVYLGMGPRVVAVDVSEPAAPRWLGRSAMLPGVVRDLAVARDHVYAIYRDGMPRIGRDGLAVLNVVDPRRPQVVGLLPLDLVPQAVAIGEDHAYVVANRLGRGIDEADHALMTVDVKDPARPQVVARRDIDEPNIITLAPTPMDIAVAGGWAFVTHSLLDNDSTGIRVYDLWNPAEPLLIGKQAVAGEPRALAADASGRRLFLVTEDRFVESVTLHALSATGTDIAQISALGSLRLDAGGACGGALALRADRVVYLDRCAKRLHVVDASDPARLRETYAGPAGAPAGSAVWAGRYGFVAGGAGGGMTVLDLADPDQPAPAAELPALGAVRRLARQGETIYATDPQAGLWAIDSAALAGEAWLAPPRVAVAQAGEAAIAGGRLLVAAADPPGVHAFAIGPPSPPRLLEAYPLANVPKVLAAAGDRLYAGFAGPKLTALTVAADGLRPLGEVTLTSHILQFAVDEGAGRLVAQTSQGFAVLDGGDLALRREVKEPPVGILGLGSAGSLAVMDGTVYMAVASGGFDFFGDGQLDTVYALDVDSEESAVIRGRLEGVIGDHAGRILAREGRIAVSGSRQTALLTMPEGGSPEILAAWASPGTGADLVWDGDRFFLADGEGGLCLLELVEAAVPTAVPSTTPTPLATRTPTPVPTPHPTTVRAAAVFLPYAARGHAPKDVQPRFSLAGQIGGPTWALAAVGDRLYRAEGPHVVVLDASEPASLREIGRSEVFPGLVVGLAVTGNTVLVGVNDGALYTLDVGDTGNPRILARLTLPDWPRDILIAEGLAYVAAGEAGVLVVDPSVPARPRIVSSFQIEGSAVKVQHDRQRLYVTTLGGSMGADDEHLHVFDARDPFQPRRLATLGWEFIVLERIVTQGKLFTEVGGILQVFDLSDPTAPVLLEDWSRALSTLAIDHDDVTQRRFSVVGPHLLMFGGKLLIADVSGQAPPTAVGEAELPGTAVTRVVTDRLVYSIHPYGEPPWLPVEFGTLVRPGALVVTDISDPAQPRLLATHHGAPIPGELFRVGDILYQTIEPWSLPGVGPLRQVDGTADHRPTSAPAGAYAVDISDPGRPRGRGFVAELDGLVNLAVDGKRGFGTFVEERDMEYHFSLVALDLTDPLAPRRFGSLGLGDRNFAISLSGSRIYRLAWNAAGRRVVEVYDVTDPAHMRLLGSADLGTDAWSSVAFAANGGFVHIIRWRGDGARPWVVLDLTDPGRPGPLIELPFPASGLAIAGNKAYIVSETADGAVLSIFDLLDQTAPRALSTTPLCPGLGASYSHGRSLLVTPDELVLIGGWQTVCAADAGDPARPRALAASGLPGYVRGDETFAHRFGLAWAADHAFIEYFLESNGAFLGLASLRLNR